MLPALAINIAITIGQTNWPRKKADVQIPIPATATRNRQALHHPVDQR